MNTRKIPIYIKIILAALFFLTGSIVLFAQQSTSVNILPTDENIYISGANYVYEDGNELVIHRHSDKVYDGTTQSNLFNPTKARTSSGITLSFKTSSPTIVAKFKIAKGLKSYAVFSIFQDDVFTGNKSFKYEANKEIILNITPTTTGKEVVYKITFPLKTDIHFLGLEFENGHQLIKIDEESKPVYVAYGDSITHGTGQKTTPETFAYQIADKFGYELFNLAVGGGKTSQVMAEMIADDFKKIDVMTILIGFNDYNGVGIDTETYAKRYEQFLNTVRAKHPHTKIYCIAMTYTTQVKSKKTRIPAEDFRKVVRMIVSKRQKRGDKNLYLIEGEEISSKENLKDIVHFSVDGARNFANALYLKMK